MKQKEHSITFLAGQYIVYLFTENLSTDLLFHNFHHTANVVRGVRHIAKHSKLAKEDKEVLLLAAWFHDSGFIRTYAGHEAESQAIAWDFLKSKEYPTDRIDKVMGCIAATKMPQQPQGVLQQVMCDADLFHLSLPEYHYLQRLLLEEWKLVLKRQYTHEEWVTENLKFLTDHSYFTTYGQLELQKGKEWNINKYRQLMIEPPSFDNI